MRLKVLEANVLVKPIEQEVKSVLHLPDNTNFSSLVNAKVIFVGPDCKTLSLGDRIWFSKMSAMELEIDKVKMYVIPEKSVSAYEDLDASDSTN